MQRKMFKKAIIMAAILIVMPVFAAALPALAQAPNIGMQYTSNLGLANSDPRTAAVSLVKLMMTFLGIIAVVIMLLGGFKWMTAAGNDDKVAEAKKLIAAGIIGLIIILSAFLIVNFVVTQVSNAL